MPSSSPSWRCVGPFGVALAAAWQFLKAASWFDGTVEKPLRPEESGARPIATPLIADGSASVTKTGVEVADIRPRFLAYVVDVIVAALLSAIPVALASLLLQGTTALLVGGLLAFIVVTLYFPYFWHATGQTPGMRVTKVRVVHEIHVGPISWGTALKRYVVFVFGALAFYIGWLWVFVDPRKKAWHDIAADTIVIDASTALTATTEAAIAAETAERAPVDPDDPTREFVIAPIAAEVAAPAHVPTNEPLVIVQGLKKHFPIYGGVLRKQIGTVYAVDGVDFEVYPGETFSLVGESGCGKTTLGRTVIQLTPSTDGRVVFDGYELADVDPDDMRPLRRRMQIIFQDPFGSLNPRMPVSDLIGEGLLSQGLTDRNARDKRVEDSLELVGLRREYSRRYPHEFSGGQRQRIGVARALALGPDFIVADEPVSALDVSIQSQVLNLLLDLKRDLNLTYLFISHNLSVVQYFSRPGWRHVPRQDRRGRDGGAALPGPAPSVHRGAPVGDPGRGSAPAQEAPRAQGRRAVARGTPVGLPVPHPVLAARAAGQPRELRHGRAAARPVRGAAGSQGRLPLGGRDQPVDRGQGRRGDARHRGGRRRGRVTHDSPAARRLDGRFARRPRAAHRPPRRGLRRSDVQRHARRIAVGRDRCVGIARRLSGGRPEPDAVARRRRRGGRPPGQGVTRRSRRPAVTLGLPPRTRTLRRCGAPPTGSARCS